MQIFAPQKVYVQGLRCIFEAVPNLGSLSTAQVTISSRKQLKQRNSLIIILGVCETVCDLLPSGHNPLGSTVC
jgi:hypothetical protein